MKEEECLLGFLFFLSFPVCLGGLAIPFHNGLAPPIRNTSQTAETWLWMTVLAFFLFLWWLSDCERGKEIKSPSVFRTMGWKKNKGIRTNWFADHVQETRMNGWSIFVVNANSQIFYFLFLFLSLNECRSMFGWRRWTPSWNLPSSRRQRANSCLTKLSRQSVSAKSGSLDSSIPTARVIRHGWSSTRRYIVIIGPWFLFLSLIGILLHL